MGKQYGKLDNLVFKFINILCSIILKSSVCHLCLEHLLIGGARD